MTLRSSIAKILFTLTMVFSLNSCAWIFPAPIGLSVSTHSTSTLCSEGLQATLTVRSDQAIIESPKLTKINDGFYQQSNKIYAIHEKVRLEAHCYEPNGVQGKIVIEGSMRSPDPKGGNYRVIRVHKYKDQSDPDYCINKDLTHVKIISSQEPFPCVSRHGFQSDAADFE